MEQLLSATEFEHDPQPEDMPNETWEILQTHATEVRRYEVPLLQTLRQAYPERFPRVCGPASIALAHVLSRALCVPITNRWNDAVTPPHLRLRPSWFNPSHDPYWGTADEHTFLEDITGTGYSLSVDPTIRLQHGASIAPGVTRIEWHHSHLVDFDMAYTANMHRPLSKSGRNMPKFSLNESSPRAGFRDADELMHGRAVFEEVTMTSQGNIHEVGAYWGPRLWGVILQVLKICE